MISKLRKMQLEARKAKDSQTNKFLSTLISDCDAIGKKSLREPTDDECLAVVKSWLKKAKETLKANDNETTRWEIETLTSYLPKQMTEDEIKFELVKLSEVASEGGDSLNMGMLMQHFKKHYNGQYDGRQLSIIVKEFLKP